MHRLFEVFDGFAPAITVLIPVAVLLGAISVIVRSHSWRTVSNMHDPLIDAALGYAIIAAAYLVLTPQPHISSRVQLFPGDDLWTALRAAPGDAQPWIQLAGNLLLLLPLGALVPLRVSWFDTLGKVAFGGVLTACSIELTQLLFVGGRVASTDDVMLNSTGVIIGGLLVRGPWWHTVPVQTSWAAARGVGPQHSVDDEKTQTVWGIMAKIKNDQQDAVDDRSTSEMPAATMAAASTAVGVVAPPEPRSSASSGRLPLPVNQPQWRQHADGRSASLNGSGVNGERGTSANRTGEWPTVQPPAAVHSRTFRSPATQRSESQDPHSQALQSRNPQPQNPQSRNPQSRNPQSQGPRFQAGGPPVPQTSVSQYPASPRSVSEDSVPQHPVPQHPVPQHPVSQQPPHNPVPHNPVPHNSGHPQQQRLTHGAAAESAPADEAHEDRGGQRRGYRSGTYATPEYTAIGKQLREPARQS